MTPYLPYAWQEKGETLLLPADKGPRLNVVGLLNTDNQLAAYTFETTIDTEILIACIDNFALSRNQPTMVVGNKCQNPHQRCVCSEDASMESHRVGNLLLAGIFSPIEPD